VRRDVKASTAGSTMRHARGFALSACVIVSLLAFAAPANASQQVLPDNRGWEMVTPPDKNGNDVVYPSSVPFNESFAPYSSVSGDAAAYTSFGGFPDSDPLSAPISSTFIAQRGAGGWTTKALSPPQAAEFALTTSVFKGFSGDLSKVIFKSAPNPPLSPEATAGTPGYYLLENGAYRFIGNSGPSNTATVFRGASEDFSHIAFYSQVKLTPDSPNGLVTYGYVWNAATGELSYVGYLPNGSVAPGDVDIAHAPVAITGGNNVDSHPISIDGERVFFTTGGKIYVRIGDAATQDVSGATSSPQFQFASVDGKYAFFIAAGHLYRYDVDTEQRTDLTPAGTPGVKNVIGISDDGSRAYFGATGVLAAGAVEGAENLYLWTDDGSAAGSIQFVSPDAAEESFPRSSCGSTTCDVYGRVTPDGMHAIFASKASLTGYDNNGKFEVYVYDAASGELQCASCNPSGAPATADGLANGVRLERFSRNISDDGRWVFFNTSEALVPGDTNGVTDAYRYDTQTKEVALLSSGTSGSPSEFSDASASGKDAFFVTRQRLVGSDFDSNLDIYDARVDGGFDEEEGRAFCQGEECRAQRSAVPSLPSAASASLVGGGNVKPAARKARCGKGKRKARRNGKTRCVKAKKHHKHHKHHKRAHANRRAGK
jgi:Tol biopolymer transport system component